MIQSQEVKRIILGCFDDLMEHLMQDAVNSVHLKNLKNKLSAIRSLLDEQPALPAVDEPINPPVPKKIVQRGTNNKVNKEWILKMAFVLSKYDYYFFNNLFGINLNQDKVFKMIAAIFDIKASTLRNYRDAFDSHVRQVNSNRVGWESERLAPDLQAVKDICADKTEEELTDEIRVVLEEVNPDIDLLIKVAFAFLFLAKSTRNSVNTTLAGEKFEIIIAPYPDRVAYMVFTAFDNVLPNGIYPAIYVYRKFGKIFTVFGESESTAPAVTWDKGSNDFRKIREYFSADEVLEISKYPNTYLDNYAYNVYELESSSVDYSGYMLELAQEIVNDLKVLIDKYVAQSVCT